MRNEYDFSAARKNPYAAQLKKQMITIRLDEESITSECETTGLAGMSFKAQWYRDKFAKKRQKGFRGYPVATVAFYGPDDKRATKVSVGIIASEDAEADALERWFSETTDVRTDPRIIEAILHFIEQHGAKSIAAVDRIIGCPHEEGTDYPEGQACPQCPFWENRDRWSGAVER